MERNVTISSDVFLIPTPDKEHIIYAPRRGLIIKANGALVSMLKNITKGNVPSSRHSKVLGELVKLGLLTYDNKEDRGTNNIPNAQMRSTYKPTRVTLLPTYRCNLRCIYCYARGGVNVGDDMSFDVARSAIDFIIKNGTEEGVDSVSLSFHGGGEPFLPSNFPLIKRCVRYLKAQASKYNLHTQLNACTNGVIRRNDLQWVINTFDHLNVSIDGPKSIQDAQRPLLGKGSSFNRVMSTLAELEKKKFPYGLRSTITDESALRIPEIVNFLHQCSPSVTEIHLEPLFICGRCESTSARPPKDEMFIEGMRAGKKVARQIGISLFQAGTCPTECSDAFCGAVGENFFVTPHGDVTTCLEVCRKEDQASKHFFIGKHEGGAFTFYPDRIAQLQKRTLTNLPFCNDCFAKWNCSGDCLAKSFAQTGSLFTNNGNSRCKTIRTMLTDEIRQYISDKEVVYA